MKNRELESHFTLKIRFNSKEGLLILPWERNKYTMKVNISHFITDIMIKYYGLTAQYKNLFLTKWMPLRRRVYFSFCWYLLLLFTLLSNSSSDYRCKVSLRIYIHVDSWGPIPLINWLCKQLLIANSISSKIYSVALNYLHILTYSVTHKLNWDSSSMKEWEIIYNILGDQDVRTI